VLAPLAEYAHPDLLVGLKPADDAAIYRLRPDLAIVQTLDFFPPVVDDPYAYGAVAAANAMSDVFAKGGRVLLALNIAGFPEDFPHEVLTKIFQGGADKVAEAGGVVAGGHTVIDREPKYGLSVTGVIDPKDVKAKGGARPGDRLVLTKPLGTGVVATAGKFDKAKPEDLEAAIRSMVTLNLAASRAMLAAGAAAATDITGFGLLGHAAEMARNGLVRFAIDPAAVPILPGARDYARRGLLSGGAKRNRAFLTGPATSAPVALARDVDPVTADLLFDSETSGGLLIAVPPDRLESLLGALAAGGARGWPIGEALTGAPGIEVRAGAADG
jgi:selenide,water dikinase